jgi:Ca-activated chloride channel family protein
LVVFVNGIDYDDPSAPLSDLGDGFYSYVDDFAEAERLFRDELVTTLVPVAEEARAQVRFDPSTVASYRLIGYDNRAIADEDFTDPGVDAGELGAGHHATALYEVRLADGVEPGTTIGRATVRWNRPEGGPTGEASTDLVAGAGEPRGAFALQSVVADLAQLLKRTPFADRAAGLSALEERTAALVEADVPGSREVLDTIRLARTARPGPHLPDVPPPIR